MRTLRVVPKFDWHQRKGWLLAFSYSCPICSNRLWGDKEYAWCETEGCAFHCAWNLIPVKCSNVLDRVVFSGEVLVVDQERDLVTALQDISIIVQRNVQEDKIEKIKTIIKEVLK
jgi:hypothetical protein